MKETVCIILTITTLFCLIGCSNREAPMEKPAMYYYCTDAASYKSSRKTIDFETRETVAHNDLQSLLNDYLEGPLTDALVNPFPDGSSVESLQFDGAEALVTLNSKFSRLVGKELILACSCFSLTLFGLADCQSISFQVNDATLDGSDRITMHRNDIILESETPELS